MYEVGGKMLNGIKRMHVNSLACARANWDESSSGSL